MSSRMVLLHWINKMTHKLTWQSKSPEPPPTYMWTIRSFYDFANFCADPLVWYHTSSPCSRSPRACRIHRGRSPRIYPDRSSPDSRPSPRATCDQGHCAAWCLTTCSETHRSQYANNMPAMRYVIVMMGLCRARDLYVNCYTQAPPKNVTYWKIGHNLLTILTYLI